MTDERWPEDDTRSDGLRIMPGAEGLVILPKTDGLALDRCPCCDKPFRTTRAAQLVADAVYPMLR